MSDTDLWIVGIYMTKFGKHPNVDVIDLASEAVQGALGDAGVTMDRIGVMAAGSTRDGAKLGQRIAKQVGQTGVPIYNVSNACATGATALRVAAMSIKAGESEFGLAVGVEKLSGAGLLSKPGSVQAGERFTPQGRFGAVLPLEGRVGTEIAPAIFAQVGMEYAAKDPRADQRLFARISEKNHGHSVLNPLATYNRAFTLEEIMSDVMISYPNTRPMCSANCDGAAAVVLTSGAGLRRLDPDQRRRAVKISASVLTSDPWTEASQVHPDVNTLTQNAAAQAYEQAGVSPSDLGLVELHDCFATAELVHYENLKLCPEDGAVDFFESGAPFRDGALPVNVSGGLQSKGHPIAATGIANIWEICQHLRGEAGPRQLETNPTVGLAHVVGLGSSCAVHVLEKAAS